MDGIGVVLGEATSAIIDENFKYAFDAIRCARYSVDLSHANSDTNSVHELQTQRNGSMVISGNTS